MAKKYIVDLNKDEKAELVALTQKGRPGARKIKNGRVRWTLPLLADRLVALTRLESLSYEAVRLVLKKTISNPGNVRNGVSLPS